VAYWPEDRVAIPGDPDIPEVSAVSRKRRAFDMGVAAKLSLSGDSPGERTAAAISGTSAVEPGAWLARLDAASVGLTATVLEGTDDATAPREWGDAGNTIARTA